MIMNHKFILGVIAMIMITATIQVIDAVPEHAREKGLESACATGKNPNCEDVDSDVIREPGPNTGIFEEPP